MIPDAFVSGLATFGCFLVAHGIHTDMHMQNLSSIEVFTIGLAVVLAMVLTAVLTVVLTVVLTLWRSRLTVMKRTAAIVMLALHSAFY